MNPGNFAPVEEDDESIDLNTGQPINPRPKGLAARIRENVHPVAQQLYARNPQAGTPEMPSATAYKFAPQPAAGSDAPAPDPTDYGILESPAIGSEDDSPAGPAVVPQQLGRNRGALGMLAQAQDAAGEEMTAGGANHQIAELAQADARRRLAALQGREGVLDSERSHEQLQDAMDTMASFHARPEEEELLEEEQRR